MRVMAAPSDVPYPAQPAEMFSGRSAYDPFATPNSSARNEEFDSVYDRSLSGRTADFASVYDSQSQVGAYETPNCSARTADFASVYDSQSHCGSARVADLSSVYEHEPAHLEPVYHSAPHAARDQVNHKKKQRAYAAAFGAFGPPASAAASSSGWTEHADPASGRMFYHNAATGETSWEVPSSMSPAAGASSGALEPELAQASLDPRQVFSAARHGRYKEVEASLDAGFDFNYADSFGNTLFHVACQNGNKRISKMAIKYGGDMDAQNLKGNTGVHFLFTYGYQELGEYFIEKGASDQILNEAGEPCRGGVLRKE